MDQLRRLLDKLSLRQKISIVVAVLVIAGGMYFVGNWNTARNYKVLFAKLTDTEASGVLARLKEQNVEYKLENGGTILVPSEKVYELRINLAAEGVPKSGIGYELFDKPNLGVTDFTEKVNHRRATEGELARTIGALGSVESARVHLSLAKESMFADQRQAAKASIMVKLKTGETLAPQSAQAILHLTAGAVEGLQPENITVVDMHGNLLAKPKKPGQPSIPEPDEAQIRYRTKIEDDLLVKVNDQLAKLGSDHYRAGVSAEIDFSSGEQSEERFDPERSVMTNQQRSEDFSGSTAPSGVPGTPSNLPRPSSRPGETGKNASRRNETTNYQSSRTIRRLNMPLGSIKRLSVSVLVDHNLRWEGAGPKAKRILEPPTPETLNTIKELVAATAGVSLQRGDTISVLALPFEATLQQEPPPAPPPPPVAATPGTPGAQGAPNPNALFGIQLPVLPLPAWVPGPLRDTKILLMVAVALLLVLIGAIAFVVLRLKAKKKAVKAKAAAAAALSAAAAEGAPAALDVAKDIDPNAIDPNDPNKSISEQLAERRAVLDAAQQVRLPMLQAPTTNKTEVLTRHLTEEAKKDPAGVAYILRNWLEQDDLAR
ncbi:MAG: flagellar basal-body MS-ring/collar protein FliF [Acidobacteria bacterium]|nr:flagellar basal-body MS-ring/collar protein FliF [Acidobacteriota bacterium]